MNLKLDENLSQQLQPALAALGHDVATVADEGLLSQPDPVIAAAARAEGRMLLTLDVEFADLRVYPPGSHPGMLVFRPRSMGVRSVRELVLAFVQAVDLYKLVGCVVVIESDRVRIRRPEPPGDAADPQPSG